MSAMGTLAIICQEAYEGMQAGEPWSAAVAYVMEQAGVTYADASSFLSEYAAMCEES